MAADKTTVERRKTPPEQSIWWKKLTLAQKFSASSLGQFGYELSFVRNADTNHRVAILSCDDKIASISEEGDIDSSPNIKIR